MVKNLVPCTFTHGVSVSIHVVPEAMLFLHMPHWFKTGPGVQSIFTRESSYCFQHILAIAILSVRPSVTRVDQAKTVQAIITKSSPSAA